MFEGERTGEDFFFGGFFSWFMGDVMWSKEREREEKRSTFIVLYQQRSKGMQRDGWKGTGWIDYCESFVVDRWRLFCSISHSVRDLSR